VRLRRDLEHRAMGARFARRIRARLPFDLQPHYRTATEQWLDGRPGMP
jgi:hypothetical protein